MARAEAGPPGAGVREARTNSGEGILARWDWKVWDQGAAGTERWDVVVDMFVEMAG